MEIGFNELNNLLQEKDDQINQLREFISSQEGNYLQKGVNSSKRINDIEAQLQLKNNEFYKLQDEFIRQEQLYKLELNKLKDEIILQVNK